MHWASTVMSISMEMVLPALLGIWLDRWLGTGMVFLVLGSILGFTSGMWHLLKLAKMPPVGNRPTGFGRFQDIEAGDSKTRDSQAHDKPAGDKPPRQPNR